MYSIPQNKDEVVAEIFPFYSPLDDFVEERPEKLYLIPTTHGENYDPDFSPQPSSSTDLPEPERWTRAYVIRTLEILGKRRPLLQIARNTHRHTYNEIASRIGTITEIPKMKRIHQSYPIDGVIEVVVILSLPKRSRALALRFEGVDGRWLCTEFDLL